MRDDQLSKLEGARAAFPDCSGWSGADLQHPRRKRHPEVHAGNAGMYWARIGIGQGDPRPRQSRITTSNTTSWRISGGDEEVRRPGFERTLFEKINPRSKEKKVGADTSVNWPAPGSLGGKGNEGVAGVVKQTPNSIGYVELIYAIQTKMSYGEVKNSAGKFLRADLNSVTAAAAGAAKDIPADFRFVSPMLPEQRHIPFPPSPGCWFQSRFRTLRRGTPSKRS